MRERVLLTWLLLGTSFIASCGAPGSGGGARGARATDAAAGPLQDRAALALVDAGVMFRPVADVTAPLAAQIEQVQAHLDGAEGAAAAPLRLELATLYYGSSLERPEDRDFLLDVAESEATEAAFAFGDGTPGGYAAYYVLGQVIGAQGRAEEAADYYRGVIDGLAESEALEELDG